MITSPDDDVPDLLDSFDALIDGELAASEAESLIEQLRTDDAARLAYVEYLDVHLELLRLAGHQQSLRGRVLASVAGTRTSEWLWIAGAALAAAVLMVGFVGVWMFSSPVEERVAEVPTLPVLPPAPVEEPAPPVFPVVATLTYDPDRTEWIDSSLTYEDGMALRAGDTLELGQGIAEVRFHSGARCILSGETEQGASSLSLLSDNGCALEGGLAAFVVPQAARGFEVKTATGRVIDLGTEFGLTVKNNGHAEVHVIDGLVQAATRKGSDFLALREGTAAVLDPHADKPFKIPFRPQAFVAPVSFAHGIDSFSSMVYFHSTAPRSLLREDVGHFNEASLVAERTGIMLTGELRAQSPAVQQTVAGRPRPPANGDLFTLPAGLRVDSFLVHCSWQNSGESRPTDGEIRFRRPIVAVIGDFQELKKTTPAFGLSGRTYPSDGEGYGLEVDQNFEDRVVISADRRTIRFRLSARQEYIDQMRVLVTAESE